MFGLHLSSGGPRLLHRSARVAAAVAVALGSLSFAWAIPAASPAAALTVAPGQVLAWGYNGQHQTEVPAEALSGVTRVSAGCTFSLALKGGKVIAWGDNTFNQVNVPAAAQSGVVAISAGCSHSLALKSNGTIVAWGDNTNGELNVPTLPSGWKWLAIGAGEHFNFCVATNGSAEELYRWGAGIDSPATPPWRVADAEAGQNDYVILKKDGTVSVGGDGPPSLMTVPPGLSGVTQVDIGRQHALALKSDGTVVAWGENGFLQTNVPSGLSGVVVVAAGGYHSMALSANGGMTTWGRNNYGQGTPPTPPGDMHYTYIAAGTLHSLGIVSASVPGAPTNATATAGDGAATISWQAPAHDGGSPITGYTVTSTPDGKHCTTTGALTCSIGGLTNGTGYVFTVKATNIAGTSPASGASTMVYPQAAATPPPADTPTPEPGATETPGASGEASGQPSQSPGTGGTGGDTGGGGGGTDSTLVLVLGVVIGLGLALVAIAAFMLGRRGRGKDQASAVAPPPDAPPPPRANRRSKGPKGPPGDDTWNDPSPF
jgi:hypothetical protein